MIHIELPEEVQFIMNRLDFWYESYICGGAVRDSLLGIEPHDWDITTNALPYQVKDVFSDCKIIATDTALKHGTITLHIGNSDCEITTFRSDVTCDGRHATIAFENDIVNDLARRDITINAMAYNRVKGLVDPFKGLEDLQIGIIRCVGNPQQRFQEDYLRMLRAIRFAARFGFAIEEETLFAICDNASGIKNVSKERIWHELIGILESDNLDNFSLVITTGLMRYIEPSIEIVPHNLQKSWFVNPRLTAIMLVNGIGEIETEKILRNLTVDRNTIAEVINAIRNFKYIEPDAILIRHAMFDMGNSFGNVLKVHHIFGTKNIEIVQEIVETVFANNDLIMLNQLAVNGKDMLTIGFKGKEIGNALNHLMNIVLDDPDYNDRELLLNIATDLLLDKRELNNYNVNIKEK